MNERIKELMTEAGMLYTLSTPTHITEDGTHTFTELYVYDKFDPEKFAELIVLECGDFVATALVKKIGQLSASVIATDLVEHFGVEE